MKMIIDISKDVYDDIKYRFEKQDYECGYIVASTIVFGTSLEEELGDIKTEIRNKKDGYGKYPVCDNCIKIIDKHISEMKGDK